MKPRERVTPASSPPLLQVCCRMPYSHPSGAAREVSVAVTANREACDFKLGWRL